MIAPIGAKRGRFFRAMSPTCGTPAFTGGRSPTAWRPAGSVAATPAPVAGGAPSRSVLERQEAELAETRATLAARNAEVEKLQLFLSALKRQRFGRSSEKCHPDQLALSLEAIEEQIAALQAKSDPLPSVASTDTEKKPGRRPLPGHLPREERRHEPAGCAWPDCGGKLH